MRRDWEIQWLVGVGELMMRCLVMTTDDQSAIGGIWGGCCCPFFHEVTATLCEAQQLLEAQAGDGPPESHAEAICCWAVVLQKSLVLSKRRRTRPAWDVFFWWDLQWTHLTSFNPAPT